MILFNSANGRSCFGEYEETTGGILQTREFSFFGDPDVTQDWIIGVEEAMEKGMKE